MAIQHELPLLSTLATGLGMAFVCGFGAAKLRIPPIVGYLFAGILIGSYTPGFVADAKIAEELAEIGIVLLMFGVGLHFSIKDLMEVKQIAVTGALAQIVIVTALGSGLAHMWGWSLESGILFGLALSVASTVVLMRSFEERNLLQTTHGHIAIGWLVVEDLAMILALVLIPALAGAGQEGAHGTPLQQLFLAIGKVGLFVIVMLVGGKRILPWLLSEVSKTRSRELFTLTVFAMAIGIAFGAAKLFDVSFALGAFFAGMMIRESDMNHEVANRALPFQDAFAVLFFVSVGMLFNPSIIVEQPLNVLAVTTVIILGNFLSAFSIIMMFGYPLKTGLLVSSGLSQIGEFSFILVSMGMMYGILPDDGRSLVLAGALASIAFNPLVFRLVKPLDMMVARSERLSRLLNRRLDPLAHLRSDEKEALRDLVILVGHGRVGRHISQNIKAAHIDLVIIDSNRERVQALRQNGFHAIVGDATQMETLKEAMIEKAVAVAVAVPDAFEARRIVETAKSLRYFIKILVRAHNEEEVLFFEDQKVDLVLTGPREIGRRMADYLNKLKK